VNSEEENRKLSGNAGQQGTKNTKVFDSQAWVSSLENFIFVLSFVPADHRSDVSRRPWTAWWLQFFTVLWN
jgi:hypothetical protein